MGNVEVGQVGDPLIITTRSGDVTVRGFQERVTVDTQNGDVTLYVPTGFDAMVELEMSYGSPQVEVPLSDVTKEDGRVTGTLGDGRGHIRVKTDGGQIRLLPE
jgi:DUF4097 and DUF4098 domain-containing protein YvlB